MTNFTHNQHRAGYTLADIMVAVSLTVLVGLIGVYAMNSGAILYAKNTAENLAHDSSRIAVNRMLHDIHNAVSIPQLGHIDYRTPGTFTAPTNSWVPYGASVTFYAETGTGPSAGVSFQMMGGTNGNTGGPFNVVNDPANPDLIKLGPCDLTPQVGMRLIFPYYNMEDDITKATSTGANHYNVWTANGLETRFKTKKNTYYICYTTSRWAYVVEGGQLKLYSSAPPPNGLTWPVTVARNISSASPFSQTTTQYIGINLTTEDTHYNHRNYRAVNTLLAGSVPYRAQLCVTR